MGGLASRSRLDRARELSDSAWRLRGAAIARATASPPEDEPTARLVRRQLPEAGALCRAVDDNRELATALRRLGHVEQDAGRGDAAARCYQEAVAAARRTGDPLVLAHAIRHLGDAHRAARRFAPARTCYAEALALYAECREPPPPVLDRANVIRRMAILEEALGEGGEARRLWQEARALYAAVPIAAGVAECEENLARLG